MEFRRLGNSGLVISELAFGNWITHGAQIDEETAQACVRAALDAGITTFDTADVYSETRAETVLGKALAGQRREGLVLSTKVCHPVGPGPNDRGLSRKHVVEGCEASLRRLGTDYVDVYYAHRYDPGVPLEETMLAFADLVRSGKVLYVGVSEWTVEQISRAAGLARELRVPLVASQPQYSMLWRVIESQVVPACEREGLGQVVWSPLAQGILSGKYRPGAAAPADSRAGDDAGKGFVDMLVGHWLNDEGALRAVQELGPVAADLGLTMSQLALAWVLKNPSVSAAIIGASRPEQVKENVAASGVRLEQDVLDRIDGILGDYVVRDPARTG
ncbi:aryl-alcohol dehydrogenase-like predicted oxidoreductase [Streptomyces luteogriseus]|uniref:Aryl-alcohol dehydrogenase-like predicted oxidoreductase n=1 Tax=Streptomyces luteogriseus TaxID=68233 RepID=A0A7W7DTJ1_9ACTN|nr:aldo/keto reductase family protein [Streptomyces luteogriseus]MBB4716694.1 aryl-alcohol dehydrogenase-like predicted oxidoreductase [Streptomyces luteogriseus]